jgi:hypothetical protein
MVQANGMNELLTCIEEVANELTTPEELAELTQDRVGVEHLAKQALMVVVSVTVIRYANKRWLQGHNTAPPTPLRIAEKCLSEGRAQDGESVAASLLEALRHPAVQTLTASAQSPLIKAAIADQQERLTSRGCSNRLIQRVAYRVRSLAEMRPAEFAASLKELNRRFHERDWEVLYEGEGIKGRAVVGPRFVLLNATDEICSVEEAGPLAQEPAEPQSVAVSQPSTTPLASTIGPDEAVASAHLRDLIPEFNRALSQEISASKGSRGQYYTLKQGRHVGERDRQQIYSFEVEEQIHVPDESPIALRVGEQETRGVLVAAKDYVVVVSLDSHIGERVPTATLLAEPWFLLEELQLRMTELLTEPCGKAELLLRPAGSKATSASASVPCERDLNQDQQGAVRLVLGSEVAFIWGPPGTGKTTTLGATVAALADEGETVLVTAHSNVAVDVAMHAVLQWMPEEMHGSGEVLRFGPIYRHDLEDLKLITVEETVRRLHEDLIRELRSLQHQERVLLDETRLEHRAQQAWLQLKQLRQRLMPIEEKLDEIERELVRSARVVGCTLSKAEIAREVIERRFDAVVVDEVSMASIPACVYAASRATKRVAVFGDFRQLSPIAISDGEAAKRWLKRDVYEEAGIVSAVDAGRRPEYLAALQTQYRMTSTICGLVNQLAYGDMLKTADGLDSRLRPQVALPPEPGRSVIVVDTERMKPYCYQEAKAGSYSRFNPASALASMSIASEVSAADSSTSIAIVTPYAAQARLLNAMVLDSGLQTRAKSSTVHRFQGGEEDVVILDLSDGRPQKYLSKLLWEEENHEALRLLNVALSRAKAKVFIVGETEWLSSKCNSAGTLGLLLRQLIDHHVPFHFLSSNHTDQSGRGRLVSPDEASSLIEADLSAAKRELLLRYAAEACDDALFGAINDAVARGVAVTIDCLHAAIGRLRQRASGCAISVAPLKPLETVCRVDDDVLWLCSWLCPNLKYADRPTVRIAGRRTVSALSTLLGL